MKSTSIVTKDFLERVRKPGSRFHLDYLAYRRAEITLQELIARLPHIAMIGDSVSTGMYISTPWRTFRRARKRHNHNWFLDINLPVRIRSVSRRLEELTPLVAIHYAGVGAMVDDDGEREVFSRRILGTRNFSGQIDELVGANRFPDLILVSIGHNNVDWAWRSPPEEIRQPESRLRRIRQSFKDIFVGRFRKLLDHAQQQRRRTAIMVFGLVNFGSYFKGRAEAERQRANDPRLYPHLEKMSEYLISFRPNYRQNVVRLTEMVNDDLRAMVAAFNRNPAPNVQLRYSGALATTDLSRPELLHAVDAWHASPKGHNVLADAAFGDLAPSLKFLGIH
jgi:lysophospholipase L1-like esterase